jgi:hypothetical protein
MTQAGDNRISLAEIAHIMVDSVLVAGSACARQPPNFRIANHSLYLLILYLHNSDVCWYSRFLARFFGCYGISRLEGVVQAALEKRPVSQIRTEENQTVRLLIVVVVAQIYRGKADEGDPQNIAKWGPLRTPTGALDCPDWSPSPRTDPYECGDVCRQPRVRRHERKTTSTHLHAIAGVMRTSGAIAGHALELPKTQLEAITVLSCRRMWCLDLPSD